MGTLMPKQKRAPKDTGATVGYEAQLWEMADALRGSMDAAEYKHVVLGLIFVKYISDAFEEKHTKLLAEKASGADPEDPDEYRAQSIFWVPPEAPPHAARLVASSNARPDTSEKRHDRRACRTGIASPSRPS